MLLRFFLFLLGWAGLFTIKKIKPDRQIFLLRILGKLVVLSMRIPAVHRIYHSFRKHGHIPREKFLPRASWNDVESNNKDIAVMFSGGKDSTYVAWYLSHYFKRVHLLTLRLDAIVGLDRCEINIGRLQKSRGRDKFIHHYIDDTDLFVHFYFKNMEENRRLYGPTAQGASCTSCKVALECQAVIFCKKNGIHWMSWGYNPQSHHSFDQSILGIQMSEAFLGEYGIRLTVPLWEKPGTDSIEELYRSRVIPTRKLGKAFQYGMEFSTQGLCPLGIWTTVNQTRHEFTRGFSSYLNLIAGYRKHLEKQGVEYLRDVHSILHDQP
ncbi:hypothetical protein ACFL4G_08515 [Thermodesulfobacteriota bacterium]